MSHDMPMVSVIMPAYNAAAYIAQSIDSVLEQSHRALELIVVDDGSLDATAAIVELYRRADPRVQLVRIPNSGKPSIARNTGIALATGDYLSFLDSDDYWHPERLALAVAGMQAHPEWIASFHDLEMVDVAGRQLGPTYLQNGRFLQAADRYLRPLDGRWYDCNERFFVFMSLRFGAVHTLSILIDRRQAGAELRFDENYVICEDTDLWLRLALRGRFGYLDRTLGAYRQHATSITKNVVMFAEQSVLFHENNFMRIQAMLSSSERQAYRRKLAGCKSVLAYHCYRTGQSRRARMLSLQAFAVRRYRRDLLLSAKTLIPHAAQARLRSFLSK